MLELRTDSLPLVGGKRRLPRHRPLTSDIHRVVHKAELLEGVAVLLSHHQDLGDDHRVRIHDLDRIGLDVRDGVALLLNHLL